MASNYFNMLSFAVKSPLNFKMVIRIGIKKILKIFEKRSVESNTEANLSWIKTHCSDYQSIALELSPSLLEETVQFSEALRERSIKILEKVNEKLGGGGIY